MEAGGSYVKYVTRLLPRRGDILASERIKRGWRGEVEEKLRERENFDGSRPILFIIPCVFAVKDVSRKGGGREEKSLYFGCLGRGA